MNKGIREKAIEIEIEGDRMIEIKEACKTLSIGLGDDALA